MSKLLGSQSAIGNTGIGPCRQTSDLPCRQEQRYQQGVRREGRGREEKEGGREEEEEEKSEESSQTVSSKPPYGKVVKHPNQGESKLSLPETESSHTTPTTSTSGNSSPIPTGIIPRGTQ